MREENALSVQKSLRIAFFGTMREENVLSVPKNFELPFFWDYEGEKCSVSSKKSANRLFLGL